MPFWASRRWTRCFGHIERAIEQRVSRSTPGRDETGPYAVGVPVESVDGVAHLDGCGRSGLIVHAPYRARR
jgi:hypothetical protein